MLEPVEEGIIKRVLLSLLNDLESLIKLSDDREELGRVAVVKGGDRVRVLEDIREMLEDEGEPDENEELELSERVEETDDDASFEPDKVITIDEGANCAFSALRCDVEPDDNTAVEVELSIPVSRATWKISTSS